MKFGTALLFNARGDWLDSYVDYEALKKAIPSPATPTTSKPARPSYTDLESAPLLPSSDEDTITESHQPFFDLLAKELRKVAKFYESEEQRLIEEGQTLEKEIEDEETREERDREREVAEWAAEDRGEGEGLQDVGEEGESTIGSLGVHLGGQVANASRGRLSRSRSANSGRGANISVSPTRDTSDLFEAQQSIYAARLRTQSQTTASQATDGDEEDSSPENSPNIAQAVLPSANHEPQAAAPPPPPPPSTQPKRGAYGAGRRSLSSNPAHSPVASKRRRRQSILSASTAPGITGAGDLGLVLVDSHSLSVAGRGGMSDSMTSEAFGGHGMVNVWTSNGQRASMLKIIYKRRIAQLWLDWNALRGFRELNQEGVKKALKKFDKITSSKTKDAFLANTLPTYYPWLADVKALLEQQDQMLVTTYARVVVGGDKEIAGRQLGSQLREKVVIERDTVWRQMVQAQRSSDLPGGLIRAVPDPRASGFYEQEKAYAVVRTPFGTVHFPRWLSKSGLILILAWGLFLLLVSGAIPTFEGIEERNCCAMLILCTILWATEAMPIFVTSLMVPFLVVILRVIRSTDGKDTRLTAPEATKFIFSQMFTPTIMLLIGGFTIAAALSKTRMDVIMATRILNLAGTRPSAVLLCQMAVATFASMWISNVAAPTLCFALIKPVTDKLPPGSSFARCLIIAIALASNIGGQASPISSPQNLIALQAMEPALDWLQWFAISLPVASCSIILIWAFLHFGYRWDHELVIPPIKPHGDKFSRTHWFVLGITLFTIGLWCVEKRFEDWVGDMGVIAIIPMVAFFGTSILSKEDFHNFHWSIVFIAMGGSALGKAVLSSGLLDDLDSAIEGPLAGLSLWQVLACFSVVVMVVSTFVSHTIAAVLLVPLASRIGESLESPHPRLLIMATALICSAGMGLPVSGFPNMSAIAQQDSLGNRYLNSSDFLKNGVPATGIATVVIVTLGYGVMRMIGL